MLQEIYPQAQSRCNTQDLAHCQPLQDASWLVRALVDAHFDLTAGAGNRVLLPLLSSGQRKIIAAEFWGQADKHNKQSL